MDPVTAAVVAAVAAGALSGVGETAAQAVKDTYVTLKNLLSQKYRVDVSGLERRPDSESKKSSLAEDLTDAGAAGDAELGEAAAAVLGAVQELAPEAARGVDIEGLRAGALNIANVTSAGDGARLRNSDIAGTVDIRDVRAGVTEPPHPQPAQD